MAEIKLEQPINGFRFSAEAFMQELAAAAHYKVSNNEPSILDVANGSFMAADSAVTPGFGSSDEMDNKKIRPKRGQYRFTQITFFMKFEK